jgi:tetratricopeptide (TPR) repeat protein
LAGKNPKKEFLVLRAEGFNMIAEHEKALRDAREARTVVGEELGRSAALQIGIAHMGLGAPDSARHWFERALGATNDTEALLKLGVLDRIAGHCAEAVQRFDQVLAADTGHVNALRERGICKAALGDTASARRDLDHSIELAPRDPVGWNSRGYFHAQQGRYREAIADYDQAIKYDPNYSYAFNNRGWAYYKVGDKEKAMHNMTLAVRKKRNSPYVYRNFGVIALEEGDNERACRHFRTALDMHFTELYGTEVEELILANCKAPATPAPPPEKPALPEQKTNAPVRSNAP